MTDEKEQTKDKAETKPKRILTPEEMEFAMFLVETRGMDPVMRHIQWQKRVQEKLSGEQTKSSNSQED